MGGMCGSPLEQEENTLTILTTLTMNPSPPSPEPVLLSGLVLTTNPTLPAAEEVQVVWRVR